MRFSRCNTVPGRSKVRGTCRFRRLPTQHGCHAGSPRLHRTPQFRRRTCSWTVFLYQTSQIITPVYQQMAIAFATRRHLKTKETSKTSPGASIGIGRGFEHWVENPEVVDFSFQKVLNIFRFFRFDGHCILKNAISSQQRIFPFSHTDQLLICPGTHGVPPARCGM